MLDGGPWDLCLQTGKKQVDLLLAACNVRRPYCEEPFSECKMT